MAIPLSYNVRNVRQRWQVTVLAIGGIALVVAVFITLIALYNGFRTALASTGTPRTGSSSSAGRSRNSPLASARDNAEYLSRGRSGGARRRTGRPLASPELVVAATLPRKDGPMEGSVQLRGVSPMAFVVRGGVTIVEGRVPQPGLTEIIVGQRLLERFEGMEIGDSVRIKQRRLARRRASSAPRAAASRARSGATWTCWRRPSIAWAAISR